MSTFPLGSVRRIPFPQRLLLASSFFYGGVFALLLAFGRPGLGLSQGFYVPIILAALATGALGGFFAGVGAASLLVLAAHTKTGNSWSHVIFAGGTGVRFVSYVAAGMLVGVVAAHGRRMLTESLRVLEELLALAGRDLDTGASTPGTLDLTIAKRSRSGEPFALLVSELAEAQRESLRRRRVDSDARGIARLLAGELGPGDDVARISNTQFAIVSTSSATEADVRRLRDACELTLGRAGWDASVGWATSPEDGRDTIALYSTALERLHARLVVRGHWHPTPASAGLGGEPHQAESPA
jgi:GGDEF domain-containing protein